MGLACIASQPPQPREHGVSLETEQPYDPLREQVIRLELKPKKVEDHGNYSLGGLGENGGEKQSCGNSCSMLLNLEK